MNPRAFVSLLALAWADVALAQLTAVPPAITNIIPDTDPSRSLGTNVSTLGPVTTIDGGSVAGSNLFHSFSAFDLAVGDTARWTYSAGDPGSISNVVNRVTGGTASQLFGMLDSTALPNADFFFINPAGIVFGDGAQVNVPAASAAHFSTASSLHFASGETFAIATPDGSTLSISAPTAFGFLGNESSILFKDAGFFFSWLPDAFLPSGAALSLSAANVTLDGSFVQANGVAVTATGTTAATIGLDGSVVGDLNGSVVLQNNSRLEGLEVNGGTGNLVSVNAGQLFLDGSEITTRGGTFGAAGPISIDADELYMNASRISSTGLDTDFTFTAAAGPIDIDAGTLSMTNSFIESGNFGSGSGGDITIDIANQLFMDGAWITADNSGTTGSLGGSIIIHAGQADLVDFSRISAVSFGSGGGGSVDIAIDGHFAMTSSRMFVGANGSGDGGLLSLNANSAAMTNSLIDSRSLQGGESGDIDLNVSGLLDMVGTSVTSTVSSQSSTDVPTGGSINVSAETLLMRSDGNGFGSGLAATAIGTANGGEVHVLVTDMLHMADGSAITASSQGSGNAGSVSVSAGHATLESQSSITSSTSGLWDFVTDQPIVGVGNAGSIEIAVGGQLSLLGSNIQSDSEAGHAGSVTVNVGSALLDGISAISSDASLGGDAGTVTVAAGGLLDVRDYSRISTTAGLFGSGPDPETGEWNDATSGNAGLVDVSANDISLSNGAMIVSQAWGHGDGGSIFITTPGSLSAYNATFIGSDAYGNGNAGEVFVQAGSAVLDSGGMSTRVYGSGVGGGIALDISDGLSLQNSYSISSETLGTGLAGGVSIEAGSLFIESSEISSNASQGGDAGFIDIVSDGALVLGPHSLIGSSAFFGDAGFISIQAANMVIQNEAIVDTSVAGDGSAGDITILVAGDLEMDHGRIQSLSELGAGDAGFIDLQIGNELRMVDSQVVTDARGDGAAGNILVRAESADLIGSLIRSATFGAGAGGSVLVDLAGDLTMDELSRIDSASFGNGTAGDIVISADDIELYGIIASNAPFEGNGGTVTIDAHGRFTIDGGHIVTSAGQVDSGPGYAGQIFISANELIMSNFSNITSGVGEGVGGAAGSIVVVAPTVVLDNAQITSNSRGARSAGTVSVYTSQLSLNGSEAKIGSENVNAVAAAENIAGSVFIEADDTNITNGARISTNSLTGIAGNIDISMPGDGLLIISGKELPGVIETSSGPGLGGIITIASPLAIISNGGSIMALGESGGANVHIDTKYFISSTDRPNIVAVDGTLNFTNSIYDVSSGTVDSDLSLIDASGVLRGQCSAVRSTGSVSQLNISSVGPYGAAEATVTPQSVSDGASGGCQ